MVSVVQWNPSIAFTIPKLKGFRYISGIFPVGMVCVIEHNVATFSDLYAGGEGQAEASNSASLVSSC